MDPATLTAFLIPFLPTLLSIGNKAITTAATKAGETAGTQLTESAFKKAKAIWEKLYPKIEAKSAAQEAVEDMAEMPGDLDLQAALRVQLKKILDADLDLATAIAQIFQADTSDRTLGTQINQNVSGNQNQVIGQVSGGQVIGNFTGSFSDNAAAQSSSDAAQTNTASITPIARKTILILAANPQGTSHLQLAEEVRNLQIELERARHRDRFMLEQRWAVSADEVRFALFNLAPQIVHFSGHGIGSPALLPSDEASRKLIPLAQACSEEGLIFQDENGKSQIVSGAALAQLFSLFAGKIECVVLNACYSSIQAKAIARHIPYVIGMKQEIGDRAAIQFTKGFYDAIFVGASIEVAYRSGCSAIQTENIPEHLTPVLEMLN